MKGRKPTKAEQKYMDKVRDIGCIVCLNNGYTDSPAAIHHLDGRTKAGAHYHVIPLCPKHHQHGDPEKRWVSRHHDGVAAFEKEYGTENELLLQCMELISE